MLSIYDQTGQQPKLQTRLGWLVMLAWLLLVFPLVFKELLNVIRGIAHRNACAPCVFLLFSFLLSLFT